MIMNVKLWLSLPLKNGQTTCPSFLQKLIIETPWLNHLRPKSDEARWSRISFDVNCSPHQAPSVKSVGITGQLTGSRADLMVLDDIEVPGNSMTELMREKLLQLCTEAESILTPKNDSRIMYPGDSSDNLHRVSQTRRT